MQPEQVIARSVPRRTAPSSWRISSMGEVDPAAGARVRRLLRLAVRGLPAAYLPGTGEFARTLRAVTGGTGVRVESEGTSLRGAAVAALGLARVPLDTQRQVLTGRSAAELALLVAGRAEAEEDVGTVALAARAAVEAADSCPSVLLDRLGEMLDRPRPMATVDLALLLVTAVSASGFGGTHDLVERAASRLLYSHGPAGIWPHRVPSAKVRAPEGVGTFEDQAHALQALARASALTGDHTLLRAADRTAARLCGLQGPAGQWPWRYDVRHGAAVGDQPVHSVHQHALAPMALLDLLDAGGADHRAAVAAGLAWLDRHPEVVEEVVSERFGLVWRRVGAGEGASREDVVDHECRPDELGWLLVTWLPSQLRVVEGA